MKASKRQPTLVSSFNSSTIATTLDGQVSSTCCVVSSAAWNSMTPSCVSQIYPGMAQICEGRLIFISQGLMAVRRLSHIRSFTLTIRRASSPFCMWPLRESSSSSSMLLGGGRFLLKKPNCWTRRKVIFFQMIGEMLGKIQHSCYQSTALAELSTLLLVPWKLNEEFSKKLPKSGGGCQRHLSVIRKFSQISTKRFTGS